MFCADKIGLDLIKIKKWSENISRKIFHLQIFNRNVLIRT